MNRTSEDVYFSGLLDSSEGKKVAEAHRLIDVEKFEEARVLLNELVKTDSAPALYLSSSFSCADEKIEDYEKRHLQQLKRSADLGCPPALHKLAVYYDSGEYVQKDAAKAALLFKRAAELGYSHSQWIHGEDLLYGRNGITKDEALGLWYIRKAAEAKFEGALETLAEFHEKGLCGIQQNLDRANQLRKEIEDGNVVNF